LKRRRADDNDDNGHNNDDDNDGGSGDDHSNHDDTGPDTSSSDQSSARCSPSSSAAYLADDEQSPASFTSSHYDYYSDFPFHDLDHHSHSQLTEDADVVDKDMNTLPVQVPSIPVLDSEAEDVSVSAPLKTKKKCSLDVPPKCECKTKCVWCDGAFDLTQYLKDEKERHERETKIRNQQHDALLERLDQGNKQHAAALEASKSFNCSFLDVFKQALTK
jgi:hypothetical protein